MSNCVILLLLFYFVKTHLIVFSNRKRISKTNSLLGLQMNALKNLGLNVVKANVFLDSSGKHNKFSITKA